MAQPAVESWSEGELLQHLRVFYCRISLGEFSALRRRRRPLPFPSSPCSYWPARGRPLQAPALGSKARGAHSEVGNSVRRGRCWGQIRTVFDGDSEAEEGPWSRARWSSKSPLGALNAQPQERCCVAEIKPKPWSEKQTGRRDGGAVSPPFLLLNFSLPNYKCGFIKKLPPSPSSPGFREELGGNDLAKGELMFQFVARRKDHTKLSLFADGLLCRVVI